MIDLTKINDLDKQQVDDLMKLFSYRDNIYMKQKPLPKQQVAMSLQCRELLFGGAAGGGKSSWLLMDALQGVDVQGYSAIIFRKTFADLMKEGSLISRAKDWLINMPGVKWKAKENKFEFLNPDGTLKSTLAFGYLATEEDKYKYQGAEFQFIGFDEVTHISKTNYLYLFSRLRKTKDMNIPLKVRCTCNPPSESSQLWVKERFYDKETKEKDAVFISSGIADNPYLDQEEYLASLEGLDEVTKRQLRDGDWLVQRSGEKFKEEWFNYIPKDHLSPYRRKCRYWDMASTDKTEAETKGRKADFTAGVLVSEFNGCYFIEDVIHGQYSPKTNLDLQGQTAIKDGYSTMIREEQEPGSAGKTLVDFKKREIFNKFRYEAIKSTGSKVQRAELASKLAEERKIYIVEGCNNIDVLLDELASFPIGQHDDTVDAFTGAINVLHTGIKYSVPKSFDTGTGSYWGDSDMTSLSSYSTGYFGNI